MHAGRRAVVMGVLLLLSGCRTAHDVAVTSYRVATAPINMVRHQPTQPSGTTVTTTTTTSEPPAAPAPLPPSVSRPRPAATPAARPHPTAATTAEHKPTPEEARPRATASPRPTVTTLEFPTAKPVEGKPGYVYSPFDPGKYVDVSGYAPGSKVKDPYSGKIFLVP
jgi:hypothetical protein